NRSTPQVADLDLDGVPDVVIVDQNGEILLRLGRDDIAGAFAPPRTVNPDPEDSARDVAVVRTRGGVLLAALNTGRPTFSLFAGGADGRFTRVADQADVGVPGNSPVRIASADLNGDELGDIAVATTGGAVFVYFQDAKG